MVLRRLARSIREQNWFSVALEVVIVVVGIFIGLQVNDWHERQDERDGDQRALALFVDELQLMRGEARDDLKFVTASRRDLALATGIAMKCDASEAERSRLVAAIGDTLNWRVPDVRPSGIAEIGNSGTLARLGSPALSRAVGSIHQSIKTINDSMAFTAPQYDRAWKMLLPHLVLKHPISAQYVAQQDAGPSIDYLSLAPQETLCGSQEFLLGLALLTDFYDSNVYNFTNWNQVLAQAQALAEAEKTGD